MDTNQSVLSALADETRFAIVERLRRGPASVAEIAGGIPVSRPAVSQHLRVLREAGLLTVRPEGTRRVYALDPRRMRELRDYFDDFWRAALASFKQTADEAATHRKGGRP